MNDFQSYLQDLLTIDCELQVNLQQLALVTSRESLEVKSNEIKRGLREFKEKLNEIKDFCDTVNQTDKKTTMDMISNTFIAGSSGLINRLSNLSRTGKDTAGQLSSSPTTMSYSSLSAAFATPAVSSAPSTVSTSPKDLYTKELQIQKEQMFNIESRFRNAYLAAMCSLEQAERSNLMKANEQLTSGGSSSSSDGSRTANKKVNINQQILLKQSNEMTSRLRDINRQLKWTEAQTSNIIPVLDQSSRSLQNTQQEFGTMKTMLLDGKRLLIRLSRRELTDKLLTILCLLFFFSVVFYIVWKRMFSAWM